LRLSEFRKEMQEELNRIEALERKVQQQLEEIQKQTTSDNSEKAEVAETISQSTMYSPVSGHYEVPFLAKFTPLASQSDTLETPPVKLKIAV